MKKIKSKVKPLTKTELKTLGKVLDEFDKQTTVDTGVNRISGGFALADMFNYDDDYIDIQLKWGIQSDCEDSVHTEQWKLKRSVLSQKKTIKQMVVEIED
jgi:hypothetical protein